MGGGDASSATNDVVSSGGGKVTLNIRSSNGSKFTVDVELETTTVGSLKTEIASKCEIPPQQQRLIYKGRILKDDQTLKTYGLEADHTIHLVRGFSPAASPNTTNTGPVNTSPAAPRDASPNEGGPLGGSGLGASLFPGLGANGLSSGGGLFGAGLPEFEQVQQQLTQNPNMMRDIMNMPLVQNLMNNPEIMRNMIMNNPQMRDIIERNPELGHILNDPATLRQTMEAARNPELMREMMRNTDRAMSNIEASPEGFNMLRRMYENVQDPLLNAATMTGDSRNDVGSNPFAALLGAQGGAAVRDQTSNPPTAGAEAAGNPPAPNTNPLPNPWASGGTGRAPTTPTARPAETGEARAPVSGLGGLGLPEMLGAMPDASSLNQSVQNPAMSQMMQSVLSNPQQMNQILGLNPALRNMMDSNPQLREMMQNPDLIRQLTSPEMMQQLMTLQQGLGSQVGQQRSAQEPGQTGGGAGMESLMNMFGLGAGGLAAAANRPNVPPEEQYATQLAQLQEMGFFDPQENIRALIATAGNVHAAVERLLGNLGQ
ncbi:scaffold/adaptor protein [Lithospermum erythrorhizon]|uniref:Scaffold/adaptor protein n=1 Tax=Lithospermum erythrorhizon TaxID=34254 RepID=A0AAV3NVM2_LITER